MIANLSHIAFVITLVPREQLQREWAAIPPSVRRQYSPQRGTPYPSASSCSHRPVGSSATRRRGARWPRWISRAETSAGRCRSAGRLSCRRFPRRHWGSPNHGGTLTTAGGLVFIAAARDTALRAFDVESGTVLWEADLPTSAQATPMTYRSASGKQFVVIAAGATRGSGPTAAITSSRSRCREARGACIRLKVMPYHTALASTSSLRGAIIPG